MIRILPSKICRTIFSIWMIVTIPAFSFSQPPATGTLTGIVKDKTDAVIPNVVITAVNTATGVTKNAVADERGKWVVSDLPYGTYKISLDHKGFVPVVLEGIVVSSAASAALSTKMQVAAISDTTQVFADAERLHVETAEIGKSAFTEELTNVTSATHSFTGIIAGLAGVSTDISRSLVNSNGNQSSSVNGARTTSTSLQFNGIDSTNLSSGTGSMDDNIAPSVEFLQEVRVQSSLYDASVGRSGGGNVMLYTQTGVDKYHGAAFFYGQNEALNANEFFLNGDGIKRPVGQRYEGGFTLGGLVPISSWKDKLKFFGGYQKTDAQTGYVPTARTLTQIPTFLGLIKGERTEQTVRDAIVQESVLEGNTTFATQWLSNAIYPQAPVSPVALQILNLRNPVTGDYWIPSPRTTDLSSRCNNPYGTYIRGLCDDGTISNKGQEGVPVNSSLIQGQNGNFRLPFAQERIISPASFDQSQYTARVDFQMTATSSLSGNYFFSDFPSVDPFTDPNSQASPVSVKRLNRGSVASLSYQQFIGSAFLNEARVGMFSLRNTRQLDDPFLDPMYSNAHAGISNPATFFDNSAGTNRLGRFYFTNNVSHLSFGASNDAFNKRELNSYSVADSASWIRGAHHFKFGGEVKLHHYNTSLPEQQGTEFQFDGMFQFIIGKATQATTRFGVTDKRYTMLDAGYYFADDWKVTSKVTLNLGVRWDLFGAPEEQNGRIANFDLGRLKDPSNPLSAIVVASNANDTGFAAIDRSLAATARASTNSTLRGQDLNNFAPRFGFAYAPWGQQDIVIRGGYGFFYDRPSAAFINTIYKNYPFMHQIKVGGPHGMVPIDNAFSLSDPTYAFSGYLPYYVYLRPSEAGQITDVPGANPYSAYRYELRDATPVTSYVDGTPYNPIYGTNAVATGNPAVPFEFRAVDPNLRTPYVQQWNIGIERAFSKKWTLEIRYQGAKGTKLLQAIGFNQAYDLNDPKTPDYIFGRLNDSYETSYGLTVAGCHGGCVPYGGPLASKTGWTGTERERGVGKAFGFLNPITGNEIDYNLSSKAYTAYQHQPDSTHPYPYLVGVYDLNYPNVIPVALRTPILGMDPVNATMLHSNGNSSYNALQMSLIRKLSNYYSLNLAYTWSKSIDTSSSDPGSAPGTSRPDVPNSGNIVMGDQRNIRSSRGVSDFDRSHRLTASFAFLLPTFESDSRWMKGWQLTGSGTIQSGAPYSVYASGQELTRLIQYYDPNHRELYSKQALSIIDAFLFTNPTHVPDVNPLAKSTGGLYGALYARPSVVPDGLKALQKMGDHSPTGYFNTALLAPSAGGFGNLGRNVLRASSQSRMDVSLSKTTEFLGDKAALRFRLDILNVLNHAVFAAPSSDVADYYNLGNVLYTIGGPRVMQFSIRVSF